MGSINSRVHSINRIHFMPLKDGVAVERLVKAAHQPTYVLTKSGRLATDCNLNRGRSFHGVQETAVRALVGLGVVTADEARAHAAHVEASKRANALAEAVDDFTISAKRLGVTLTDAQEIRLGAYASGGDPAVDVTRARIENLNKARAEREAAPVVAKPTPAGKALRVALKVADDGVHHHPDNKGMNKPTRKALAATIAAAKKAMGKKS